MSTEIKKCPLVLTAGAIREVKMLRYDDEVPADQFLRIGVKGGGCSGLSYILGFAVPTEADEVYEIEDVKLIIDRSHTMYVMGMEVDFEHGLNNRGFTFKNPNATDTCGCGTSFTTE